MIGKNPSSFKTKKLLEFKVVNEANQKIYNKVKTRHLSSFMFNYTLSMYTRTGVFMNT